MQNNNWIIELAEQYPSSADPRFIEAVLNHHHQQLQKSLEAQAIQIREEEANEYNKIIERELQKARKETEKAYGGCHYCYGKGYGTQTASWVGRGYYKKLPTMKFCSCERGKQLEQLLHSELYQDTELISDWRLAQKDKEVAHKVKVATIEAWNDAVELSDRLEESNTKFDEWRAFKCFRNALRDKIIELVEATPKE